MKYYIITILLICTLGTAHAQRADTTAAQPTVNLALLKKGNHHLRMYTAQTYLGIAATAVAGLIYYVNHQDGSPTASADKASVAFGIVGTVTVFTASFHVAKAADYFDQAYGIPLPTY
jgi:hypothetical protein